MIPVIAITMGDYNGIGPEVILKALPSIDRRLSIPVAIGHEEVFRHYARLLGLPVEIRRIEENHLVEGIRRLQEEQRPMKTLRAEESPLQLPVLPSSPEKRLEPRPGREEPDAGKAAMLAVAKAIDLCLDREADAMVTAPISKKTIHEAGYPFPGHTEFLADRTGTREYQMILVTRTLRVALATIHIPLASVPDALNRSLLENQLNLLNHTLIHDFGIEKPTIAVLGLNPHAGDGGVLGREEENLLQPVLRTMNERGIVADGPFPADGFFGNRSWERYDAVLAMYHDQGLIPFKTLSFGAGVNFTAGLPIIRTSPDHGTGFDIAGSGRASEKSFLAAYELAVSMAQHRMRRIGEKGGNHRIENIR